MNIQLAVPGGNSSGVFGRTLTCSQDGSCGDVKKAMPGVRGLRDDFNAAAVYTMSSTPLDNVSAKRIQPYQGSVHVGTFQGYKVYKHPDTGFLYAFNQGTQDPDYGFLFYKLTETGNTSLMSTPPIGGGAASSTDCPCDTKNCREETVQMTYWASPTQNSPDDIAVEMSSEVLICDPTEEKPIPACLDELNKYKKANGLSGLSNDTAPDETTSTQTIQYVTDPNASAYLPPPVNCEKGNLNALWFILIAIFGIFLGIVGAVAWKKR